MEREFWRQVFEKSSDIKFHENPSSGSRVVPFGRMDIRRDMTKLIVAFRNFANAPENWEQVGIDIGGATVLVPRNTALFFWQVIRISWLS